VSILTLVRLRFWHLQDFSDSFMAISAGVCRFRLRAEEY
jgi:hypothetical protein